MGGQTINRFVYWAPRALSILFIAFLSLFSLDVFESGGSAGEIILGLFMHNIPLLILAAVVVIAWRRELVGAVVFLLAGLLYIVFAAERAPGTLMAITWSLIITGPAILVAALYFANWHLKRKQAKSSA